MKTIEFGKMCQPYNKEYYKLFGTVPCVDDYSTTQEQFFDALKKSIIEEKKIENYLPRKAMHSDGRME